MLVTLTWKISKDRCIDIKVNRDQKISETIGILKQKGLYPLENEVKLQSMRTKERLDPSRTYAQQGIYTGDILVTQYEKG